MREPAQTFIQFTLASAERPRVVCNLLGTELDSSIRRYRARFCKVVDFANSKLTHHPGASNLDNLIANYYHAALHQIQQLVK
jgi:hypothetical protein